MSDLLLSVILGVGIAHVVISIVTSVLGPIRVESDSCMAAISAYVISLALNLCGFWPITLIMLLCGCLYNG